MLFQEIFGINDNMRDLADRLTALGYVTLVPDMFWRIERRFERKDEAGIADAFGMVQQFDSAAALDDIRATHRHLVGMSECSGTVGAVGFCLGGGLAFAAATSGSADAAVCYYGSAINGMLDQAGQLGCPTMFHYGTSDSFIPVDNVAAVEEAVSGLPSVEFHRYDAGHAFSNSDAPSMYNQRAAEEAWGRTVEFFDRWLR
jgi:carboxymethylenebutenolidase